MGDKIARLYDEDSVPLAGLTRVKAYMRKGKDGKTVAVSAYTRSVTKMSFQELQDEFKTLENASSPQDRNRRQQVVSEIRFRGFEPGEGWDDAKGREATRRQRERTANNASRTQDTFAKGHDRKISAVQKLSDKVQPPKKSVVREETRKLAEEIWEADPDAGLDSGGASIGELMKDLTNALTLNVATQKAQLDEIARVAQRAKRGEGGDLAKPELKKFLDRIDKMLDAEYKDIRDHTSAAKQKAGSAAKALSDLPKGSQMKIFNTTGGFLFNYKGEGKWESLDLLPQVWDSEKLLEEIKRRGAFARASSKRDDAVRSTYTSLEVSKDGKIETFTDPEKK